MSELAKALAAAQGEIKNAVLNKENPHFKSRYANLASVRDAITPALSKHGLALTQTMGFQDDKFCVITTLRHNGGETVESVYPLPVHLDRPQAMGSALSYARRYSMAAIVGIAADDDDDAVTAQAEGEETGPNEAAALAKKAKPKAKKADIPPADASAPHALKGRKVSEFKVDFMHVIWACEKEADLKAWWSANQEILVWVEAKHPDIYADIWNDYDQKLGEMRETEKAA